MTALGHPPLKKHRNLGYKKGDDLDGRFVGLFTIDGLCSCEEKQCETSKYVGWKLFSYLPDTTGR